jgi:hypothetical protein
MKNYPLNWEEYFVYSVNFLPLTGGAGTAFTAGEIKVAKDADWKLYAVTYIADDARIFMRLKDDSYGRYLQKGDPDMRAIAGRPISGDYGMRAIYNDFLPFMWSTPYRVAAATTLTAEASDFSGSDNNARISFHGAKIRPGAPPWARPYRYRIPFTYEIDLGSIAASGNAVGVLSTDTDSDFLVEMISGFRTGRCTITISEGARGRDWMDRAVHFDNLVGRGHFANRLLKNLPRFITRGGNISINVTDLSAAANTVRVYFHGLKLYG